MMHKTSGAATKTLRLSVGTSRHYSVDFCFKLLEDYIWTTGSFALYVIINMETSLCGYILHATITRTNSLLFILPGDLILTGHLLKFKGSEKVCKSF